MKGLMKVFSIGLTEERMEKDRIAKRVYIRDCAYSCSMDRLWNRWIDNVKECIRKRGLEGEWYRIGMNGRGL